MAIEPMLYLILFFAFSGIRRTHVNYIYCVLLFVTVDRCRYLIRLPVSSRRADRVWRWCWLVC